MKLLFDQNLSFRLCALLEDVFPGSEQVRRVGLHLADDWDIWRFAKTHGFTIVTHDADFAEMAALFGAPPKVIWLRCGNQPTEAIAKRLRQHAETLAAFAQDAETTCLAIY